MPDDAVAKVTPPDGAKVVRCVDETAKVKWYKKTFLCIHMGQGEDDLALLDMIGHGVPVVANRNAHHIGILGRDYPLYAIRPDVQSIRACIKRAISHPSVYTEAVACMRTLKNTSYSNDSATKQIKALFCETLTPITTGASQET